MWPMLKMTFVMAAASFIGITTGNVFPAFSDQVLEGRSGDSIAASNRECTIGQLMGTEKVVVDLRLPDSIPGPLSDSSQPDLQVIGETDRTLAPAFWIVDTRLVPNHAIKDPKEAFSSVRFFTVDECGKAHKFHEEDWLDQLGHDQNLWLVVHGNRVDFEDALVFMRSFRRTADQLALHGRLVLWSWPSGVMVRGILRDSRLKAARADLEAALLAFWLARHNSGHPVVLLGYSFGARTVLRAISQLEPTNESQTSGVSSSFSDTHPEYVLFLVAPAIDAGTFDRLVHQAIERGVRLRIFVTVNRSDFALRWYRHLWSHHGANALGWGGPACQTLRRLDGSLDVLDVTRQVGRTHRWQVYLKAPAIRNSLQTADSAAVP
ncbi:MAG: alpha/beta hydrolase [Thermogutta sp.]